MLTVGTGVKNHKEPLRWAAPAFRLLVVLSKSIQEHRQWLTASAQTIGYIPAYSLSYPFMDFLAMNLSNFFLFKESKHIWRYFRDTPNFYCDAVPMAVHLHLRAGQVLTETCSLYLGLGGASCPAVRYAYHSVLLEAFCGHRTRWDSEHTPQLRSSADAPPAGNGGLNWLGAEREWELLDWFRAETKEQRVG